MDKTQYSAREELLARIENDFTYHPPKSDQAERYEQLRALALTLAKAAAVLCPESRELSAGLTHLETSVMFFNAAIARNE